jgi:hypothetical protein
MQGVDERAEQGELRSRTPPATLNRIAVPVTGESPPRIE